MGTEFGRTPQISSVTAGRGHHPTAFTWWLAGGGIKGGYVYGRSDEIGERVAENPVTMPDLNATIAHALGIDLQHIEHSPSGRPFTVADKGKPVMECSHRNEQIDLPPISLSLCAILRYARAASKTCAASQLTISRCKRAYRASILTPSTAREDLFTLRVYRGWLKTCP